MKEVYTVKLVWLAVTFSSNFWPYCRSSDVSCGLSSPTKEGESWRRASKLPFGVM